MNTSENTKKDEPTTPKLSRRQIRQQRLAARRQKRAEQKLLADKQRMVDHLDRELKFTSTTYQKAAEDWNSMMCKIKLPDFKKDLEVIGVKLVLN